MIFRAAPALLLATCALVTAGCKKEQESLLLANLRLATGNTDATGLATVKLEASGRQATYTVSTLSAGADTHLGLYLPGSATGPITVVATAYPLSGCAGFRGMNDTTIASAGVTQTVAITMGPFDTCGASGTGGMGGTGGGTAGTVGTAGTGGTAGTVGAAGTTGTAGTGGTAGTVGAAGTTGTAGTGGSAGSSAGTGGGAGRGGTTGGGGSAGTTGTGGAAGYPSISACRPFQHGTTSCPNNYVNSVAISPNGLLVATGGDGFDDRVKIWSFDGRTLTPTGTVLTGFNGNVVAFSPDGLRLAYTSQPNLNTAVIRTYSVTNWQPGPTLQDNGSGDTLIGVAFTPDSQRVVSANAIGSAGGDVFVHSLASGASTSPLYTAHVPNQPYGMAVLGPKAPNTGTVGVAVGTYYGTVFVLSLTSTGFGTTLATLPASTSAETTYTVEFSPDGTLLATGEGNGALRFWSNPAGTTPIAPAISFGAGQVNDIAFSPNGMYLAVGGGFSAKRLSIYSVATHTEVAYTVPSGDVDTLVFSPSGGAIIAGLDSCATVLVCN